MKEDEKSDGGLAPVFQVGEALVPVRLVRDLQASRSHGEARLAAENLVQLGFDPSEALAKFEVLHCLSIARPPGARRPKFRRHESLDHDALMRYSLGVKPMKRREFQKMLRAAGWEFIREGGEHEMWGRADQSLAIPRGTTISVGIVRQFHQKNAKADEEGA